MANEKHQKNLMQSKREDHTLKISSACNHYTPVTESIRSLQHLKKNLIHSIYTYKQKAAETLLADDRHSLIRLLTVESTPNTLDIDDVYAIKRDSEYLFNRNITIGITVTPSRVKFLRPIHSPIQPPDRYQDLGFLAVVLLGEVYLWYGA